MRLDEHVAGRRPAAQVAHGALGCMVSLNDMCDRPPRPLADGEVIDLGGKRVRHIDTPHVPHGWEARVLFEETTGTLLCGDLFSQLGAGRGADHRRHRRAGHGRRGDVPLVVAWPPTRRDVMRRLGDLAPTTLAMMHGSSFQGDGGKALYDLADAYEQQYLRTGGVIVVSG